MKNFLVTSIKFAAFASVFYIIFIITGGLILPPFMRQNLVYPHDQDGHTQRMIHDIYQYNNIDLLFVGSSRAYRGFDPSMYSEKGYSSFNLGTSNQTPIQTLYLLKKYFPQLNPKLIIMEVNPDIFSNDGVESTIDLLSNTDADLNLVNLGLGLKSLKVINTMIYSKMVYWFGLKNYTKVDPSNQNHSYQEAGYSKSALIPFDSLSGNTYHCDLQTIQLEALDQIIAFAATNETPIRFVQSPIISYLYRTCPDNLNFDRILHTKGNYINYNIDSTFNNTSFFSDAQHLNQKGVVVWNQMVIDDLWQKD